MVLTRGITVCQYHFGPSNSILHFNSLQLCVSLHQIYDLWLHHQFREFGIKCTGCKEGLSPTDLVRRVGSRVFHVSCLKCQQCLKEVATGDQLYIVNGGKFLCQLDYENSTSKKTATATTVHQSCPSKGTFCYFARLILYW